MNFYSADQHFGHANILHHQARTRVDAGGRVFKRIEDHDACLIERWNARVGADDTVYCLGDFAFRLDTTATVLARLHGRKILVIGNHDPGFKAWKNAAGGWAEPGDARRERARADLLAAGFADVVDFQLAEIAGKIVGLAHFPYRTGEDLPGYEQNHTLVRPPADSSECLLHGHIHAHWRLARYRDTPPMLNVGVDLHGLAPISEDEVGQILQTPVAPASHPHDGCAC